MCGIKGEIYCIIHDVIFYHTICPWHALTQFSRSNVLMQHDKFPKCVAQRENIVCYTYLALFVWPAICLILLWVHIYIHVHVLFPRDVCLSVHGPKGNLGSHMLPTIGPDNICSHPIPSCYSSRDLPPPLGLGPVKPDNLVPWLVVEAVVSWNARLTCQQSRPSVQAYIYVRSIG